ncbi:ABC-three component system middle component 6 [Pseudomonas aeruginosa]|uniref:ABC-three component system middle component 6 n=1 Tax=Pseudomonas aeruginosa TaxID=287 RepID=UPI003340CB00
MSMLTLDSDPVLNPVNIGAELISFMLSKESNRFQLDDLYRFVQGRFSVSYDVFAYTMDWLYLIDAVDMDERGVVQYAP